MHIEEWINIILCFVEIGLYIIEFLDHLFVCSKVGGRIGRLILGILIDVSMRLVINNNRCARAAIELVECSETVC